MYANNGAQPEVAYDLALQVTPNADVVIEIDGNKVESRGNSIGSAKFIWPAKSGSSGAKITVVPSGGESVTQTFPGTWGLFKMIEAGSKGLAVSDKVDLSWNVRNAQWRDTFTPARSPNPCQRPSFAGLL